MIFNFLSSNEIYSVPVYSEVNALCSLNQKYLIIGDDNKEIKVFDFERKSFYKNLRCHDNNILGIEKIKIKEKGEYIISYDYNDIKIWII